MLFGPAEVANEYSEVEDEDESDAEEGKIEKEEEDDNDQPSAVVKYVDQSSGPLLRHRLVQGKEGSGDYTDGDNQESISKLGKLLHFILNVIFGSTHPVSALLSTLG